jgi:anti-sigma factor RsiW
MTARMLSCRELIEFLADYLDGALPAGERVAFDAHLAVCPYCVDYLASYRETIHLGRQALAEKAEQLEEIPVELVAAILDARGRRGPPGARRP